MCVHTFLNYIASDWACVVPTHTSPPHLSHTSITLISTSPATAYHTMVDNDDHLPWLIQLIDNDWAQMHQSDHSGTSSASTSSASQGHQWHHQHGSWNSHSDPDAKHEWGHYTKNGSWQCDLCNSDGWWNSGWYTKGQWHWCHWCWPTSWHSSHHHQAWDMKSSMLLCSLFCVVCGVCSCI